MSSTDDLLNNGGIIQPYISFSITPTFKMKDFWCISELQAFIDQNKLNFTHHPKIISYSLTNTSRFILTYFEFEQKND